jgi:hypothetical protein
MWTERSQRQEVLVQRSHPSQMPVAAPAEQPPMVLTRWEQAEAEAAADLIDADLESCGADAVRAVTVAPRLIIPRAAEITDDDLAEAECQADLCHVDVVA